MARILKAIGNSLLTGMANFVVYPFIGRNPTCVRIGNGELARYFGAVGDCLSRSVVTYERMH